MPDRRAGSGRRRAPAGDAVKPLLARERAMLSEIIADEVARFLDGIARRSCLACGRRFTTRHGWHFLCSEDCRHEWNRGRIIPRKGVR